MIFGMCIMPISSIGTTEGTSPRQRDNDRIDTSAEAEYARARLRQEFPYESEETIKEAAREMVKFTELERSRRR